MDQHISGVDNQIGKNPEISILSLNLLPPTNQLSAALSGPNLTKGVGIRALKVCP